MASSSSGPLSKNAVYQLGQYQFKLNVTKSQEGDSTQIQAQMTKDGQSKYHSIYADGNVQIKSWRVDANESTADVYVDLEYSSPLISSGLFANDLGKDSQIGLIDYSGEYPDYRDYFATGGTKATNVIGLNNAYLVAVGTSGASTGIQEKVRSYDPKTGEWVIRPQRGYGYGFSNSYTYDGKTVWFVNIGYFWGISPDDYANLVGKSKPVFTETGEEEKQKAGESAVIAWSMMYAPNTADEEKLVARFAIETQQAVDPTQPEQWEEQPDTGDPQYRLDLTVWGALSGRHNDPLHDPSYSYVPADQDSVKGYGGGGDGGHGGGGGGGASTVIVYDFGTDKAGSKEINAYARRHGYGSSGGRGGRGGDGCIIVYY